MTDDLWLWVLAGPNGAGKSTYSPNLPVEEIVNPDVIARSILPEAPEKAALQAGRLARLRMRELLKARQSFAVETTLSGRHHLQDVSLAKSEGWKIGLVYVGLRSAKLALGRVRERTSVGGHNVPEIDVQRRYERSLQNLPVICQSAEIMMVFDNSSARQPMKPVLWMNRGTVIFRSKRLPAWLSRSLGSLIDPNFKES